MPFPRGEQPLGYGRCVDCDNQWQSRFINDAGLCTVCRMIMVLVGPNPIFAERS